jgi:IS30 family transposase
VSREWTPRCLRPDQREAVARDGLTMGFSVRQMASYLQVSPSTVRRDLRRSAERAEALRTVGPDAFRWKP